MQRLVPVKDAVVSGLCESFAGYGHLQEDPAVNEKSGLPVIRFHDLRHTAASLLAPRVTPKQLQEFLGHEDISTTLGIYTHVLDNQKREKTAAMNNVLSGLSVM